MPFKVFDAYGAASRPEATLRASGYLFVSKGIMKRARSERATFAQLMYDESEQKLGIRLYDEFDVPGDGSAPKVSVEASGVAVNILPLLRYYGLPEPKVTGKRVLPVSFEDQVIVIDLKQVKDVKAAAVPAPASAPVRTESPLKASPPAPKPMEGSDDDIPF